jgi:hypothetical protein
VRRVFKCVLQTIAGLIALLSLVVFVFPYAGKHWFRKVVASGGESEGLSYSVEAYRFQENFILGWPDAGFKIRIGANKFYEETDYQIDFSNMRANLLEFARISGDNLCMSIHYTRFEDSLSGNGTYRLLFNKKSGTLRSCGSYGIPDCTALTLEAKGLFPDTPAPR